MISPVDTRSDRQTGILIAFWIACALAIAGGLTPLAFSGTSNRIAGVIIPFGVAAIAFALNALIPNRGRGLPTLLYFVAGIGLVYGMLWMISVPLRLAVVGACTLPPESCQPGQLPSLTPGEAAALTAGVALGLLAILSGFIGLSMLYRRKPAMAATPTATSPAARSRPAFTSKGSADEPASASTPVAAAPVVSAEPKTHIDAEHPEPPAGAAKPPLELSAPEETLELPAPEPELELPAATEPDRPPLGATTAPAAAPPHKPRVRQPRISQPKTPPDASSEPPPPDTPSS
jgi:hypothetical protein